MSDTILFYRTFGPIRETCRHSPGQPGIGGVPRFGPRRDAEQLLPLRLADRMRELTGEIRASAERAGVSRMEVELRSHEGGLMATCHTR